MSVKAFEVDAFNADSHAPILMEIESSLEELSQAIARGEVDASTLDEEQFELDEELDLEADVEQKICPTAITCKPGYYPAKRPGYKPSQNGCGAEGTSWLSETVNRVRILLYAVFLVSFFRLDLIPCILCFPSIYSS